MAGWQFSRGAGQTVAVIDTGVAQHPRLGGVRAGGDYVSDGDGTADCDAHGTLVAGIIAGRPAAGDAFAGVAPAASILAIRQSSLAFEASDRRSDAQGNVTTMAYAVTRAVDLGATVVNISQVACGPAGADLGDASLGRAVRYAFERNVVVVAAAGNVDSGSACSAQNEAAPPVTTASPARFSDYVLAVGATEPTGRPAAFSLAGPWVAVAAPGTDVTSLDPRSSGLVNGRITRSGHGSIDGTSFAAPYVAGLAAAVRARFPHLSAGEVMHRITSTARHPAGGWNPAVGFGVIDPVAALTTDTPIGELPAGIPDVRPRAGRVLEAMREPDRDERPAVVALTGCGVALGVVLGVRMAGSRRR
ncbi:type VII secretion-associated serine protease mycosin [Tsukamurella sp. 8F]|uniref:type VII secretion-associated serine protease mycosin n=1 Tax=unclassified Tsukamurella TaxID=2633480 RepID=UPI0023B91C80|nr:MULTISPECIES: type VII secretion-associated serine protease mycosin [unclassified Tsukamurella]MDF0531753.1 type VII secretion-associated serine protease mycosin [Tsukamurella sp. 8J]MDF0588045.1 type VII secretion-associated serine protease mycosin [Tsukamurella sp. 8F]